MTLYLFLDESGNFDFSPSGTRYLVVTSLVTRDVVPMVIELHCFKHEVIARGENLECFHAAENRQWIRDRVFGIISACNHFAVHAVIIEKAKLDPALYGMRRFYPFACQHLFAAIFAHEPSSSFDQVVVFIDNVPVRKAREAILKGIKENLKDHLAPGQRYDILMHASQSHPYLQIVDYLSWAVYVKWTRAEQRPWNVIAHLVQTEHDALENSGRRYYKK
jgi:hypothetical protein